MAIATPPAPPRGDSASAGPPRDRPAGRGPSHGAAAWTALAALLLVAAVVAYLVLGRGNAVTYQLIFQNAGQLVKGDQVQVGGVPVGSVNGISLTDNNLARITIGVNPPIAPLHDGTTAVIRATSLSGVANRYISLSPGPNNGPTLPAGSTLPTTATQGIVDLDQIFDTLDARTRRALQEVIQGSAVQYSGAEADLRRATQYFTPTLSAGDRVFKELVADQPVFTSFLVSTARLVDTIASRHDQLTGLVSGADQTFGAIGAEDAALVQALHQLPGTLRQGTTTFTNLVPTLSDVTQLVDVSKPNTLTLAPFFRQLAPFLTNATGPVHNLTLAVTRPGPDNDLTDALRALPALESALNSASPNTVKALTASTPVTSFLRPYAPDLIGWLRDFGQTAAFFDANGHYARISPGIANFAQTTPTTLQPTTPAAGVAPLVTGQLNRCPGAASQPTADGSGPWNEGGQLDCNISQVPPG
jgi:phospholipid/cholesterol/gamma-HCH transport system substrate-binding protein